MPRLLWLAHHRPDIYAPGGDADHDQRLAVYMLSGELAVDQLQRRHYRHAGSDQPRLAAASAARYGRAARRDVLSPVKETERRAGSVTEQAAQESGLLREHPVVMGGGDVQLGSLGLGIVRAGRTAVLAGTFWQQIVNLPEPAIDRK